MKTKELIEDLSNKKLEKYLAETLRPDETVHVQLKGAFKEALICTDKRVIILKTGFMTGQTFGVNMFQLPYSKITGAEVKFKLMSGYFELSSGGVQNTEKSYWNNQKGKSPQESPNCVSINDKKTAEKFREACTFIIYKIEDTNQVTGAKEAAVSKEDIPVPALIKQLADLRDQGILSEDEFQTKKLELLARM